MSEEMSEQTREDMPESPQSSTRQKTVAIISKPDRPELSEALPALEKWRLLRWKPRPVRLKY